MSECRVSPKRRASQSIGSSPKRTNLDSGSAIPKSNYSASTMDPIINSVNQRLISDVPIRLHSECLHGNRISRTDSSSSHSRGTTISDEGLPPKPYDDGQIPTPPSSGDDIDELTDVAQSCNIRTVERNSQRESFSPLYVSSEEDNEEFGYHLLSKDFVELHVLIRVTQLNAWAKLIEISCTYSGEEVAYASGHLICRDLIRESFYESMDSLSKPTSDRIDELLDHHGYFRWSIKEYYLREKAAGWNNDLETGSILQIDEVIVAQEWQSQALGALMVTSLIDRAEKRDCSAQFAFVLPSTGCFWEVDDPGCSTHDKSRSSAEQHHVRVFLGVGFTRAAETGWFVLDVTGIDEDPGVELEKGESKSSQHKVWMTGLK